MLVLARKKTESIKLMIPAGQESVEVEIVIRDTGKTVTRLGISAPGSVQITRDDCKKGKVA